MKRLSRHAAILVVEVIALLVAGLAGLGFFLHWKSSHGGLDLALFKPAVEKMVSARLGADGALTIGKLTLIRAQPDEQGGGPIRLLLDDVWFNPSAGQTDVAQLPRLAMRFETADLLKGRMQPRFLEVFDAKVLVTRHSDGHFDYGLNLDNSAEDDTAAVLYQLFGESEADKSAKFEGAIVENATLTFDDRLSGQTWQARSVGMRVQSVAEGYELFINVPLTYGEEKANVNIAAYSRNRDDGLRANMVLDNVPAGEMMTLFASDAPVQLREGRMSGRIGIIVDAKGEMRDATLDIDSTPGKFVTARGEIPFESLSYEGKFIAANRSFVFDRLSFDFLGNIGDAEGFVSLGAIGSDVIEFAVASDDMMLHVVDVLEAPVQLKNADTAGVFHKTERMFNFSKVETDIGEARIIGSLDLGMPLEADQSPSIRADAKVTGTLTPQIVVAGWPLILAPQAREWIDDFLPKAKITDLDFAMDIPRGAIRLGEGIDDDKLHLTFKVADAEAIYVPGMTPIKGMSGEAVLRGNSFLLTARNGKVGNIDVISGAVDMPRFYPKGGPGYFRAQIAGEVPEILALIDEEPLGYISDAKLKPEMFSGQGRFSLEVMRPQLDYVPQENYKFSGTGEFDNVRVTELLSDRDIIGGAGTVALSSELLKITGSGEIENSPVDFLWTLPLNSDEPGTAIYSGVMDTVTADAYGFSVRQFLRGKIPYKITTKMSKLVVSDIVVEADLLDAELSPGLMTWTKPVGRAGKVRVSLVPPSENGGQWGVPSASLITDDMTVTGRGEFTGDGKFRSAVLDRFYIENKADFTAAAILQDRGDLTVTLRGKRVDISGIVGELLKPGDDTKMPGGMTIDASLDVLTLKNNVNLNRFNASMRHDGTQLQALDMAGIFDDAKNFSMTLKSDGSDYGRQLSMRTEDLSKLMAGLFGTDSVLGGEGQFIGNLYAGGKMAGHVEAIDVKLVNAPLIARILSAGSLDGLSNLLSGEGIDFTTVSADIVVADDILSFNKTRATGPSLGISLEGNVYLKDTKYDLNGALAPAYQFNSFLGNLPGLGEIFVNKEGEGVVAFTYTLAGPMNEPTVTVNTLSALTPGFLRRIFDPVREKRPTTDELLEEAIAAAKELPKKSEPEIPSLEIEMPVEVPGE